MTLSVGEAIVVMRKQQTITAASLVNTKEIAVVIPVKDNQKGINRLLKSLFDHVAINFFPKAIIIVDNNSKQKIVCPSHYQSHPDIFIDSIECKTPGPAAARNMGAKIAIEKYSADWLFFIDSDCLFTPETFLNLSTSITKSIAYQFDVIPNSDDWLSQFYHEHSILRPLAVSEEKISTPETLVTAGVIVFSQAFLCCKGFSEDFSDAAGEDTFFGIKLRMLGELSYLKGNFIRHDFVESQNKVNSSDVRDLVKRFYRYGKGNKLVELKLLKELDIKVDKSPNSTLVLEEAAFTCFLGEYCNPNTSNPIPPLEKSFLVKVCHTAMHYGYTGVDLNIDKLSFQNPHAPLTTLHC